MALPASDGHRDNQCVGLSRISVGVDTSNTSISALKWSVGLARECDAQVRAVMAWELPLVRGLPQMVTGTPSKKRLSLQTRELLTAAIQRSHVAGEVEPVVVNAAAGPALAAEAERCDLLVVGRTGSGFGRAEQLLFGSVAQYCLNHARGNIAVVPRNAEWHPAQTVIVGIDGSPNSVGALNWAVHNLPASSTIYAVQAQKRTLSQLAHTAGDSFEETMATAERELRITIDEATSTAPAGRSAVVGRVEAGRARQVLLRSELGADLIVVGGRGSNSVSATLVGSVAGHLARHASCPVVIVRASA